jgi:hypothetical protein
VPREAQGLGATPLRTLSDETEKFDSATRVYQESHIASNASAINSMTEEEFATWNTLIIWPNAPTTPIPREAQGLGTTPLQTLSDETVKVEYGMLIDMMYQSGCRRPPFKDLSTETK